MEPLSGVASALEERGFAILPGPMPRESLKTLDAAYEAAFASARGDDLRVGSTSTRLTDFVNRGPVFDELYVFPPLLEACMRVIGSRFKLSSFNGRTLRAGSPNQELHVDVRRESADWPLVGFILMIDEFRPDNGATRFVSGSHQWLAAPEETMTDARADHPQQQLACGAAGSLLVFNGSVWHGHTANTSPAPRRSLQGAFIPSGGRSATDFAGRMSNETRARLSSRARDVLAL